MSPIIVSVVIPTYNRKESLKKTLESLFNQTYPKNNYEIIVCDDKSTDGTENVVKELMKVSPCELRYFKVKGKYKGPGPARNVGIENARGEIIGFTDDDCIAAPTWIEQAAPHFEAEKIGGIQGIIASQDYKPNKLERLFKFRICQTHYGDTGQYATGNLFFRRKAIIEAGCFDPKIVLGEDIDLAYRVKKKGYKILFNGKSIVYHAVNYIGYLEYFKRIKNYEFFALQLKKNPEIRKTVYLGFIFSKHDIYPIFFIIAIVSFILNKILFLNIYIAYLFLLFGIMAYLWSRVFRDSRIDLYPLRIAVFIRNFIIDTLVLYHVLRGAIRYKCFVI
jgi:glycosyltransferase involved in cell wall biosynthesis